MTPYLVIDNLTRRYAHQAAPALDGVSLGVERGELVGLLGPSGSGKSTLLKLVAGIERPDVGDVRLEGASLLRLPAHRRGAVLMFQRPYLFPFLSVAENIGFGLKMRGATRATIVAEVARMLALVELPGFAERRPAQISGGEQQRVALARALVVQPRLLLLDEPLSSLDPGVRQSLQETIRRIVRELGVTTLLVTHDLSEAMSMADRVGIIQRGRLIALGAPPALYERPPNRTAAQFVGVSTFLDGTLHDGRLTCELGSLAVPAYGEQRRACFAIRPERITLCEQPGPNRVAASVTGVSYRGETSEILLQAGAMPLRARVGGVWAGAVGAQLYAHLPAEHLFEIPLGDQQIRS